jgi:septum formation protein
MTLWRGDPLVLASKSAARQALLGAAKIPFEAEVADIDERAVEAQFGLATPDAIAAHLARAKALHVSAARGGRLVLGADQTLALGARRFSKPGNSAQAADQLRALSGKTHTLHSAIAVASDGAIVFEHVAAARMTMRLLGDAFIAAYLLEVGPKVMTSVGAYQVEGAGIQLFDKIDGDHSTILGLPLLPLLDFLRRQNCLAS